LKYGVRLRGENFNIVTEGKVENLGFYTTRFVKAATPEEAEIKAVEMVRSDKKLLATLIKVEELAPKIYLEEIWPERWWKPIGSKGYTFYPMESA